MQNIEEVLNQTKKSLSQKLENINVNNILIQTFRIPGVKIDRDKFLEKELKTLYPPEIVETAISHSPAYAGIPRTAINTIAKKVINFETNKVSTISFMAGIPGGIAMLGTIPADLTQYFYYSLRIMQKLAYLFGFQEFDLNENEIDDGTLNEMLIFLGVMFGAQEANAGLKILAQAAATQVVRRLEKTAIMKIPAYVGLKTIAKYLGIQMNRQILQKSVGGAIPVLGGILIGGVSYGTFKISANRLRKKFLELPISDPEFFNNVNIDSYINDADYIDME